MSICRAAEYHDEAVVPMTWELSVDKVWMALMVVDREETTERFFYLAAELYAAELPMM
jgi:hypothetical protein